VAPRFFAAISIPANTLLTSCALERTISTIYSAGAGEPFILRECRRAMRADSSNINGATSLCAAAAVRGEGPSSMLVRYRVTRSEIWHFYWYLWRHTAKIRIVHAAVFAGVVNIVVLLQADRSAALPERLAIAVICGVAVIAWFPLHPQLLFKPEERAVKIQPEGIWTTVGAKSGHIPWTAVDRIVMETDYVYIIGTSGNAFGIPTHAFDSDAQRLEFVERAGTWWRQA
jgi:hypothetical protein